MKHTRILAIFISLIFMQSGMQGNVFACIRENDLTTIQRQQKDPNPGGFNPYPHGIELIGKDINYIPRLIPLKEGDSKYEPLRMSVPFIDSVMNIELYCELFFNDDIGDTTKVIRPIYIHILNLFHNGINISQASNYKELEQQPFPYILLWYELTEKFINWLYAQPYSDYYNRADKESTFHSYGPVEGMSILFDIELIPEKISGNFN